MNEKKQGIWIIDADANTIFINDAMADILGTTSADMARESSFNFVFPQDMANAQRLFKSKIDGDRTPFPFTLRRKDGRPVPVIIQGTPMHTSEGQFIGIVGTFTVSG